MNKIYSGTRIALRIGRGNLQKLIDRKPDIIHSQTEFTSFIMAKKIAAAVGCPIIHTYHTVYENYTHYFSPSIALGRKTVIMMTIRILSHTAAVIAPSRKIEKMLTDYGVEQPIKVVPSGLRLEKFSESVSPETIAHLKSSLGIPETSRVLITVGRAAKEKNIEKLIRYFKRLDMENTVFLIVGGGPYLNSMKLRTHFIIAKIAADSAAPYTSEEESEMFANTLYTNAHLIATHLKIKTCSERNAEALSSAATSILS